MKKDVAKDIALLDLFADHYITCPQCRLAFEELRDADYCETGMPLFQAWKDEPFRRYSMSKDRSEAIELEVGMCISMIETALKEDLSDKERWIVRCAFLSGESYGLAEAQQIVNDHQ